MHVLQENVCMSCQSKPDKQKVEKSEKLPGNDTEKVETTAWFSFKKFCKIF